MPNYLPLSLENDWPSCIFLLSLACLDSPVPGTRKRQIIEKEDISLAGSACHSLSQLKLLSIGSRALVKLAHSAVCLANICYVHYKELRWDFLRAKNVTDRVDTPKSVDAVAAVLWPSISELRGRQPTLDSTPASPFTWCKKVSGFWLPLKVCRSFSL